MSTLNSPLGAHAALHSAPQSATQSAPAPSATPSIEQVMAACQTYETASILVAAVLRLEGFALQTIRRNTLNPDPKRDEKFFVLRVPAGRSDVAMLVSGILNDEVTVKPNAFRNMIANLRTQITEMYPPGS